MSAASPRAKAAEAAGVDLRPLTESDFTDRYLAWFHDLDVIRFLDARDITRQDAIDHLRQGQGGLLWRIYAICETSSRRHIGNLKIGPINRKHSVSDMVTIIGEREAWGKGYARAAIRLGIDIAFGELKLRKLSASIDSLNLGSLKAYQAAGFVVEAALKDQFVGPNGELSDKIYVGCFNPAVACGTGSAL